MEDIQALNPVLRRLATPANRTFDLRVPPGHGETLLACIATLPPEKRVHFRTHVVGRGQTLATIAARERRARQGHRGSQQPVPHPSIARGYRAHHPDTRAGGGDAPGLARVGAVEPGRPSTTRAGVSATGSSRGDTLTGIAAEYGVSVSELRSWNNLRGSIIAAGSTLTIYTESAKN